jgi:hypothetical protein
MTGLFCCLSSSEIYQHVVPANAGTHTPCNIVLTPKAAGFRNNQKRWLWVPAFAGTTSMESRKPRRRQSTTILTRSRTLTCAWASRPFNTRKRSAGRSTPAMRCDSDSTVSPGCTVMTLIRSGRAA